MLFIFLDNSGHDDVFWCFPEFLEYLASSGRLVGIISTYPGTSPAPWC